MWLENGNGTRIFLTCGINRLRFQLDGEAKSSIMTVLLTTFSVKRRFTPPKSLQMLCNQLQIETSDIKGKQ